MNGTGESVDTQDLQELLRSDPGWRKIRNPISSCILKRTKLALQVNLVFIMSIVLNILLLHSEFIGTPSGSIPEGVPGLFLVRVTMLSLALAIIMIVLAILVLVSQMRFSICHSIGMQLVIRQLGVDSPEFPDAYRRSAVSPLVTVTASRWLFAIAIITSVLTPIVIRQYSGTLYTDVVDLLAILSLGLSLLCGGLVSEWSIRRTRTRYEQMSDSDLMHDAESLVQRNHERVLHWLRNGLKPKLGRTLSDEELEPLTQLWYEEYFFHYENPNESHIRLMESLTRRDGRVLSVVVPTLGLTSAIVWLANSLMVVILMLPAPTI
ncbi:MAG: hypothetical protein ACXADF_14075 [Candidatus Thorarchaeota archaeon]